MPRDELLEAMGYEQSSQMVEMRVPLLKMIVWDDAAILHQFCEVLKEEGQQPVDPICDAGPSKDALR